MKKQLILWTLSLVVVCGAAAPASAQGFRPGVRAGASVDPDQFYFGGQVETPPIVDRVHLRPNVDIGFGDDTTLIAVNTPTLTPTGTRSSASSRSTSSPPTIKSSASSSCSWDCSSW